MSLVYCVITVPTSLYIIPYLLMSDLLNYNCDYKYIPYSLNFLRLKLMWLARVNFLIKTRRIKLSWIAYLLFTHMHKYILAM